jgi:hypothetical protein
MPSFGSKSVCPVSQICGTIKTLREYVEVDSLRPNYPDISRSKFPPSIIGGSSDRVGCGRPLSECPCTWSSRLWVLSKCPCTRSGGLRGLPVGVPLHSSSMGALWRWMEATKVTRCTRGPHNTAWVLTG